MVLATGEQVTIGLLVMALEKRGCPARSYTGFQVPIRTDNAFTKARIQEIDPARIRADLAAGREAGMAVGAALWPKTDAEDRESFLAAVPRYAPDWLFESPADVTRRFASWC